MALKLGPGEQVIVSTRRQARGLAWPGLLFLVLLAAAGYIAGWSGRHRLADVTGAGWLAGWDPYLLLVLAAAGLLMLARICLRPLVRWLTTRYILTSRRLLVRGHTGQGQRELALAAIAVVYGRQDLLQRMLRSGTLVADLGSGRAVGFPEVPELEKFKALVLQAIEELPRTVMFDGVQLESGRQMYTGRIDHEGGP